MVTKILAGISAVLGFVVLFLRGSLANEKKERVQEDLKREKASSETSQRATEAMMRGLENEHKERDSRSYRFDD